MLKNVLFKNIIYTVIQAKHGVKKKSALTSGKINRISWKPWLTDKITDVRTHIYTYIHEKILSMNFYGSVQYYGIKYKREIIFFLI